MALNKKLLILVFFSVVLGLTFFLLKNVFISKESALEKISNLEKIRNKIEANISVIFNNVFLWRDKEKSEIEKGFEPSDFFTGDVIETDNRGRAEIIFKDQSRLRLDFDTKAVITDYEEAGQRIVRVFELGKGKIWSRVEGVLSPDSRWEVRSSNVIASVRGTTFGMEKIGTKIKVLVTKGEVEVKVIDPMTKKPRPGGEAILGPDRKVEIDEKEPPTLEKPLKIEILSKETIEKEEWIQFNLEKDKEISQVEKSVPVSPQEPEKSIETKEIEKKPSLAISELVISPVDNRDFSTIEERTVIKWQAKLVYENGETQDVTDKVKWQVVGPIGEFSNNIFTAKITDPSFAEMGKAMGMIIGIYTDELGNQYPASTPIFNVLPYVPSTIDERG